MNLKLKKAAIFIILFIVSFCLISIAFGSVEPIKQILGQYVEPFTVWVWIIFLGSFLYNLAKVKTPSLHQIELQARRETRLQICKEIALVSGVTQFFLVIPPLLVMPLAVTGNILLLSLFYTLQYGMLFLVYEFPVFPISVLLLIYYYLMLKLSKSILPKKNVESLSPQVVADTSGLPNANSILIDKKSDRAKAASRLRVWTFLVAPILPSYIWTLGGFATAIITKRYDESIFFLFFLAIIPLTLIVGALGVGWMLAFKGYLAKRKG